MAEKTKVVNVRISEKALAAVDAIAKRSSVKRSVVARVFIEQGVARCKKGKVEL